jgi:hypothetical protein
MATEVVSPSPQAHRLYGDMAMRAEPTGHLTLAATLDLAIDRLRRGHGPDYNEVCELRQSGWITNADDGGWLIQ